MHAVHASLPSQLPPPPTPWPLHCPVGGRRKSGYGCYGPPEGWLRGARVILLHQGEDAACSETWVRQEDGSRADQAPTPEADKAATRQYTCSGAAVHMSKGGGCHTAVHMLRRIGAHAQVQKYSAHWCEDHDAGRSEARQGRWHGEGQGRHGGRKHAAPQPARATTLGSGLSAVECTAVHAMQAAAYRPPGRARALLQGTGLRRC